MRLLALIILGWLIGSIHEPTQYDGYIAIGALAVFVLMLTGMAIWWNCEVMR